MKVYIEISDWDDLAEMLWSCDEIIERVNDKDLGDEVFQFLEDIISDDSTSMTQINDIVRFEVADEFNLFDEDNDEEDEEDEEDDDEYEDNEE